MESEIKSLMEENNKRNVVSYRCKRRADQSVLHSSISRILSTL